MRFGRRCRGSNGFTLGVMSPSSTPAEILLANAGHLAHLACLMTTDAQEWKEWDGVEKLRATLPNLGLDEQGEDVGLPARVSQ
jgi:hypothetical protein